MAEASTEDCKQFIQQKAPSLGLPADKAWKRLSKTKTDVGWRREFEHSSGACCAVIEPFGAGAAGLTIETAPAAAPKAPLITSADLGKHSAARLATWLWLDAMRAIGGKKPEFCETPFGPKAPKTWKEFERLFNDHTGAGDSERISVICNGWLASTMKDPACATELCSSISWCFSNDAEWMEEKGFWHQGNGAQVFMWATDAPAPDMEPGSMNLPPDLLDKTFYNDMEGIWACGQNAPTGKQAMIDTWMELKALGFNFDLKGQKKFGTDADYDESCPLEKKIFKIIPELLAEKEARAIAKATAKPSALAAKPKGL